MKINYKNYALGLIDDPKNFHFGFPDPDITPMRTPEELKAFGKSLINASDKLKLMCGNDIQYISSSFMDAFRKATPKMKDLFYNQEINDAGVLLTGGFSNGYTHTHTIYYAVTSIMDESEPSKVSAYQIILMDFSKHAQAEEHALDLYVSVHQPADAPGQLSTTSHIWNGYIEDGRDAAFWQIWIIAFCLFKKYCDIETKVVEPKNRRAKVAGQKYLNETDKRIKILDCTWFTNLVISGAFGVSGHLRWQRCGPGLSEKKLIWIDEYTKEGYERKAKILIQNEQDNN